MLIIALTVNADDLDVSSDRKAVYSVVTEMEYVMPAPPTYA